MTAAQLTLEAIDTEILQTDEKQRSEVEIMLLGWERRNWIYCNPHTQLLAARKIVAELQVAIEGK